MKADIRGSDLEILRAALRRRTEQRLVPVKLGVKPYDWLAFARPKQIPPGELGSASSRTDWRYWIIKAGRGFGKTRVGAETTRRQVRLGRRRSVALVGATLDDAIKYMITGRSGILTISPGHERPKFVERRRMLEWPNGAKGYVYTAEEPDRMRGPEHDLAWCDELASWKYPDAMWANLRFTMRARGPRGDRPQYIITTTPRPISLVIKLLKDKASEITNGTTYENAENLDEDFYSSIKDEYEGTRLGQQEIHGEVLTDNPDALWKSAWIEMMRVLEIPDLDRIVIGVDPATTANKNSNSTGIVTAGVARSCWALPKCAGAEHAFVWDDSTGIYTPAEWAGRVAVLYDDNEADRVVGETNQGGDLVEANLRSNGFRNISYKGVNVSRGKATRAEPISSLYEKQRVHHCGNLSKLEDQMTQWNPKVNPRSPDRLDAMVLGLTDLMMGDSIATYRRPTGTSPRRI